MDIRIGQGYDIHRFQSNKTMKLGGISIPGTMGFRGHSDGDVLLHAIIDAILGALALGDIGQWFPDTDAKYKDADSRELLQTVLNDERVKNWKIGNLDCTIITQMPKLAPVIPAIRVALAAQLCCDVSQISIKAKTNEHLDAIGACEAAAVHAVILLQKSSDT